MGLSYGETAKPIAHMFPSRRKAVTDTGVTPYSGAAGPKEGTWWDEVPNGNFTPTPAFVASLKAFMLDAPRAR